MNQCARKSTNRSLRGYKFVQIRAMSPTTQFARDSLDALGAGEYILCELH